MTAATRPCSLFAERWVAADGSELAVDGYGESTPAVFVARLGAGTLEKSYALAGSQLTVRYQARQVAGRIEISLHLAMPSCDGFAGRYIRADGSIPCGFGQVLELPVAHRLTLDDGILRGALVLDVSSPVSIRAQPYQTVSQSEAGFEKIMQAVAITLSWTVAGDTDLTVGVGVVPAA